MSYTPKQQGSAPGGSGNQPSQQAKTLAQQIQSFTHGQNALSQAVSSLPGAGLGGVNFANLNITLQQQQQQQQQRFGTIMKQQIQQLQQQQQQNAASEPLALTRGPADMLNKSLQQQQANGNTGAASLVNQQLQLQALTSNHSVVMQQMQMQFQAIQFQMQNAQKMMPGNQAQQTLSQAAVAQQHLQHFVQQKMLASQNKSLSTPKQHKAALPTTHQSLPQHSQQPIQSNNNLPNKSPAKLPGTLSTASKQGNLPQSTVKSTPSYVTPKTPTSTSSTPKPPSVTAQTSAKPTAVLPKTPPTTSPLPKSPSASSLTISRTTVPSQSPPKSVSLPPQIPISQPVPSPTPAKETSPKPAVNKELSKDQTLQAATTSKANSPESKQANTSPAPTPTPVTAQTTSVNVAEEKPKESPVTQEESKTNEETLSNAAPKVDEEKSKEKESPEEEVTPPVEPTPEPIPPATNAVTEEKIEEPAPASPPKPATPATPPTKPATKSTTKTKSTSRKAATQKTDSTINPSTTAADTTGTTENSTPTELQVEKKKSSPTKESKETKETPHTPEKVSKSEGVETPKSTDDRRSRRHRLKTILYQSPLPELAFITKLSVSETSFSPKNNEDKLTLFYKNEYLAVRNAEAGFFLCQTIQNVFRSSPKIRIRWLSEDKKSENIYIPDFYDTTDLECVLTTVEMEKVGKNRLKIPNSEKERIENILKKALDVERGIAPRPDVTEENPDGLDISLYKNESQIEKKMAKKRKLELSPKRTAVSKSPKKKKKTKSTKKEQRDSNESNDSEEETDNDKEYKPSQKKALLTQPKMRAQRSPLAKARAASPITIKKENTPKTKVPLKSSASGKKGNKEGSTSPASSRTDRAKRRATENLETELEEVPVKKAANPPKKTSLKTPAKATKAMSSDDELLIPLVKKSTSATKSATKNVTNNSNLASGKKSKSSDKLVAIAAEATTATVTSTPTTTTGNRPTRNRK